MDGSWQQKRAGTPSSCVKWVRLISMVRCGTGRLCLAFTGHCGLLPYSMCVDMVYKPTCWLLLQALCKYADGVNPVTGVSTRKSLGCGSMRK